jgi:LPXTG-site transpeptidase (sortase) family protein
MGLPPNNNNHAAKNKQTTPGYSVGKGRYSAQRIFKKVPAYSQVQQFHAVSSQATKKFNPAVELVRRKLDELYAKEPNAQDEMQLRQAPVTQPRPVSKHQRFMLELSASGKSLAEIQTDWHNYYLGLPDNEKHAVWQEFYATNAKRPSAYNDYVASQQEYASADVTGHQAGPSEPLGSMVIADRQPAVAGPDRYKTVGAVRGQLLDRVATRERVQLTAKHHLQSLAFGIGSGALVLIIFLFSFFNQIIIAPLIQPSRSQQNTPIILSTTGVAPSSTPEVIIPKINVQIPTIYSETSTSEAAVESSLENGVVHYPTTVDPGQLGNTAYFGHSSNNIFNSGSYKFAFVLLHTLVPGDIFYLTYNDKVYAYQVYNREVVSPSDVSVLNNVAGKQATATLITCDPPGTSINRLVVWGTQISPSPDTDTAATATAATTAPSQLANDGPTLWARFTHWIEHLL